MESLRVHESYGFTIAFDFTYVDTATNTVVVSGSTTATVAADGTFVTGNGGEGVVDRWTEADGQHIRWAYQTGIVKVTPPRTFRRIGRARRCGMGWSDEEVGLLERAGAEVVSEVDGQGIADAIVQQAFPWAGILNPLVLLDENTSDYPALVRAGPIAGYVVHFRHDAEPVVLCRSVEAYVASVRATGELPRNSLLDPDGERSTAEEHAAQHLMANAFDEDDWAALALAVPLIRANLGALVELTRKSEVSGLAEARLRRVASPEQKRRFAEGNAPAPWPIPEEMLPRLEVELHNWSRSQMGFGEATLTGAVCILREGQTRTLVLTGAIDFSGFLDTILPDEPGDLSFLEAIGSWGTGEPVAELRWISPEHVRLTVGEDRLYDWTKD